MNSKMDKMSLFDYGQHSWLLQGDRGYEGPKGSRGPTGVGYKGDKVRLNMVGNTDVYSENL